jgi:hypothetical protein
MNVRLVLLTLGVAFLSSSTGVARAAEPHRTLDEYKPKDSAAVIKAVSLSSSDREQFNPQAVATEFPEGVTHVVVWHRWEGASPGHRVTVQWFHEGTKILEQGEPLTTPAGTEAWAVRTTGGPLPAGSYRVDLLENGKTVTSIPFSVGRATGTVVALDQYKPNVAGAMIKSVSLSASDTEKFDARRVGTEFPEGVHRVVVYYVWDGAPSGHQVKARWLKGAADVGETDQTLTTPTGFGVFSIGPLSPGSYQVELLENGQRVTAIPFRVGSAPGR